MVWRCHTSTMLNRRRYREVYIAKFSCMHMFSIDSMLRHQGQPSTCGTFGLLALLDCVPFEQRLKPKAAFDSRPDRRGNQGRFRKRRGERLKLDVHVLVFATAKPVRTTVPVGRTPTILARPPRAASQRKYSATYQTCSARESFINAAATRGRVNADAPRSSNGLTSSKNSLWSTTECERRLVLGRQHFFNDLQFGHAARSTSRVASSCS